MFPNHGEFMEKKMKHEMGNWVHIIYLFTGFGVSEKLRFPFLDVPTKSRFLIF